MIAGKRRTNQPGHLPGGRWLPVLALLAALLVAGPGCQDPAAKVAAAERTAHARDVWLRYKAHDAAGTERLAATEQLVKEMEEWHAGHLARDQAYVKQRMEFERKRWADQESYKRRIEAELEGDPEAAKTAFRRLFY